MLSCRRHHVRCLPRSPRAVQQASASNRRLTQQQAIAHDQPDLESGGSSGCRPLLRVPILICSKGNLLEGGCRGDGAGGMQAGQHRSLSCGLVQARPGGGGGGLMTLPTGRQGPRPCHRQWWMAGTHARTPHSAAQLRGLGMAWIRMAHVPFFGAPARAPGGLQPRSSRPLGQSNTAAVRHNSSVLSMQSQSRAVGLREHPPPPTSQQHEVWQCTVNPLNAPPCRLTEAQQSLLALPFGYAPVPPRHWSDDYLDKCTITRPPAVS